MRACVAILILAALAGPSAAQNAYVDTILVANDPAYNPLVLLDPFIGNGWGIALRPPGAGGHFWISNANTGTTTTYVGDVHNAQGDFTPLFQDSLTVVDIPIGNGVRVDGRPVTEVSIPTGQVYNYSSTDFVVSGEGISNASKFIFVTGEGTISGWTEVRGADGVLRRQTRSVITVDGSQGFDDDRLIYTGVAVTDYPSNNALYVTNWNGSRVEAYDHRWQPIALAPGAFFMPSDGELWRPWNIQYFRTGPNGEGRLWVAFNKAEDPWEEYTDFGAIGEYDLQGNLIRRFRIASDSDPSADGELRDPWGLAIAPANFGPLSGAMLVANFGDGTIPAFDLATGEFIDFVRDASGEPLVVDGIWGITFGNGVGLGDSNALYYAAGPNGEADGTFGSVRYIPDTCPRIRTQPSRATVCRDGSAVVSVNAPSPTRLTFNWERLEAGAWVAISEGPFPGGIATGSSTDTLLIERAVQTLELRVVITNDCGSVTSQTALLDVCPADFNCDGGVDGDDVIDFFGRWDNGETTGDFNRDGSVDGDDVIAFFNRWDAGC